MTRIAIKNLLARKLRLALTSLAIVLGVVMVSGTLVLTDTIKKGFTNVFTTAYSGADAVVSGKQAFGGTVNAASFPRHLLARVRQVDGVAAAEGLIIGEPAHTQLVDRDGTVRKSGAPNLGYGIAAAARERVNPLTLVQGNWPRSPHEVVIDESTAKDAPYRIGDSIGVAVRGPVRRFRISGVVRLSSSSTGAVTIAVFDLPTAQRLYGKQGQLDEIDIAAEQDVPGDELVQRIRAVLPAHTQVQRGSERAEEEAKRAAGPVDVVQKLLLGFGGIALFVGGFVIANTLAITIAQRTRELATLRTIGASRRQLLGTMITESLAIGFLASLLGLLLGFGLAKALLALLAAADASVPKAATVFSTRTVVVSMASGVLITLVASLRPALRATRVPPIAAVRGGATLPPSRFARFGPAAAAAVIAASMALLVAGAFPAGLATTQRLVLLGAGVLALFVGVAMIATRLARPLASVLGWPASRVGGSAGALARANAMRNPARTASTAAALMIGLVLVTFVAVLATGLKASMNNAVKLFVADYALVSSDGFSHLPPSASTPLRQTPGVTVVSGLRTGEGKAFGKQIEVNGVEPGFSQVIELDWKHGSERTLEQLGASGAIVNADYASKHDLSVGSPIRLETPAGKLLSLQVAAIYEPPGSGAAFFGAVIMSAQAFDAAYPHSDNLFSFLKIHGGETAANAARLDAALKQFPNAKIQTVKEFKDTRVALFDTLLKLVYALLGLSILVSLIGIVNTLVLTVFERTREVGMLRAIGMSRRQVRRMIRHESIVTALIGAALGIPVGVGLAALLGQAVPFLAFAVPWPTLLVFVTAAIAVGLLAAILPARRAARLNVLEALQYE